MILISIPYYNTQRDLFWDAVKSLLKQSYRGDYLILIITDGCTPTAREVLGFDHKKIRYFNMSKNHGRYFADLVAITASPYEYFIPSDSDDVSDFHRLYYLMDKQKKTGADAVFHYQKVIMRTGRIIRETYKFMQQPLTNKMRHRVHWSALYKTEILKDIINPSIRCAQDTLITNLLELQGYKTAMTPRFLYTRNIRENSLTTSNKTGIGSRYRRKIVSRLITTYNKCYKNPDKIKKIIKDTIDPAVMKEVKREAKRLKQEMGW